MIYCLPIIGKIIIIVMPICHPYRLYTENMKEMYFYKQLKNIINLIIIQLTKVT